MNSGQGKKSIGIATAIATITFVLCACSSVQFQEMSQSAGQQVANMETTMDKTAYAPVLTREKTNLLIAGVDDSGEFSIADTIIIASFDTTTNRINLLSIPRDTYLLTSEATVSGLKKQGIEIPSEIKFGQITAYAQTVGMECLQKEISNTLGIPIDYYIKMDMSAFKKIVDAVGGVTMTIPEGGLYYSDPYQSLEISLDENALKGLIPLLLPDLKRFISIGVTVSAVHLIMILLNVFIAVRLLKLSKFSATLEK